MNRKIYSLLSGAKQSLFALALTVFSAGVYAQNTYTFNYAGSTQQTISLQAGTYTIETWGANGGDNLGNGGTTYLQMGGKGGYSRGTYSLATTTTVYVNVGGRGGNSTTTLNVTVPGGYNGGGYGSLNTTPGKCSGAGGGGASHVATASGLLSFLGTNTVSVLIVGGAGGGAYPLACAAEGTSPISSWIALRIDARRSSIRGSAVTSPTLIRLKILTLQKELPEGVRHVDMRGIPIQRF